MFDAHRSDFVVVVVVVTKLMYNLSKSDKIKPHKQNVHPQFPEFTT